MGFLTDLTRRRRDDLVREPLDDGVLLARASARPPARGFESSLRSADGTAVIAEVKRASPSAGPIAEDADPAARAVEYAAGGAAAVSVLTEQRHFHGSLTDLEGVRASVRLPVLRKDFLLYPSQVIESRASGADAVLLITSCCTDDELAAMLATASDLGLGVLLETHSDVDLDRALATDAMVIGVNARDLESLEIDVDAALARLARLARLAPERVAVLESGIATGGDARAAVAAGASAILVGEALMRAADPRALLKDLTLREGAMS